MWKQAAASSRQQAARVPGFGWHVIAPGFAGTKVYSSVMSHARFLWNGDTVCVCDPDLETAEKTLTPNQTTGLLYVKPSEFRHAFRFYLAIFHNKTLQHLAAMSLALQAAIFPWCSNCPSFSPLVWRILAASFRGCEDQSVEDNSREDMATAEGWGEGFVFRLGQVRVAPCGPSKSIWSIWSRDEVDFIWFYEMSLPCYRDLLSHCSCQLFGPEDGGYATKRV